MPRVPRSWVPSTLQLAPYSELTLRNVSTQRFCTVLCIYYKNKTYTLYIQKVLHNTTPQTLRNQGDKHITSRLPRVDSSKCIEGWHPVIDRIRTTIRNALVGRRNAYTAWREKAESPPLTDNSAHAKSSAIVGAEHNAVFVLLSAEFSRRSGMMRLYGRYIMFEGWQMPFIIVCSTTCFRIVVQRLREGEYMAPFWLTIAHLPRVPRSWVPSTMQSASCSELTLRNVYKWRFGTLSWIVQQHVMRYMVCSELNAHL